MKFISHASNLLSYWNSLRGKKLYKPEDNNLGAVLKCPVFVINLERSRYRREFMLSYLARLGVNAQIFQAVDGAKLNLDELHNHGIYDDAIAHQKFSRSLSSAEIACTLSHLGIYQKMIEEDIPMAMILEDDAMFSQGTANKISSVLSELPGDWEFLQLYYLCKEYVHVTDNMVSFPAKNLMPVGSAGYLIRNSGAKKILENGFPICYPADSLIGRCPRWGVILYGIKPSCIFQNAMFPTDIYAGTSWSNKQNQMIKRVIIFAFGNMAKFLNRIK